jgi:hypothetical protein
VRGGEKKKVGAGVGGGVGGREVMFLLAPKETNLCWFGRESKKRAKTRKDKHKKNTGTFY